MSLTQYRNTLTQSHNERTCLTCSELDALALDMADAFV